MPPQPRTHDVRGAEFMFSPQSVAEAIRGVYTSLLARDA